LKELAAKLRGVNEFAVTQDDRNLQNVNSLQRNKGSEFSCMIKEAKVLGMALGIACLDGIPQGSILKSEVIEDTTAPIVASFSSSGPNCITTDILKPDITAPGIDIIAAYSPIASPYGILGEKRVLKDLNYPLMQALIESGKSFTVEFSRTVTNVGPVGSTYKAKLISHINVSVKPSALSFRSSGEKKSFVVTVTGKGLPIKIRVSASIMWSDGTHNVRSPIVVYQMKPRNFLSLNVHFMK
ncbi:subtilisin-like protease sbt4.8, partial [Quercus suber]